MYFGRWVMSVNMYRGEAPWHGLGVYARKFSTVGFYLFVVEEVWCNLLTKASHYFRLMLPEWAQSGCKKPTMTTSLVTHTLGRTWGTSSPSRCTLDCMGRTLQDWGPDSRVFLRMNSWSLATNARVPYRALF